jgi:cysteine desulfurase / selenocysteine lyase
MSKMREVVNKEYEDLKSIYLNAAYFGPSPKRCRGLVEKSLKHEIDPSFAPYDEWYYRPEKSRELFANILSTSKENIFHACSVSDVNNLLIQALSHKNQHVAVVEKDYPSNVLPFMLAQERKQSIKLTKLNLNKEIIPTADWLEKNLPVDTTIFCCSWVTFDTGKKIDIIEIGKVLRKRGIIFILDVTQGLGGLGITKEQMSCVDALSCASYKWLLGPYGHAFGYISPSLQKNLKHSNANWITSKNSKVVNSLLEYTTQTLPGVRCFDRGQTANLLTIACLEGALDFLLEVGLNTIQDYNSQLTKFFYENYPKQKYSLITPISHSGNIICLKGKNIDSHQLEKDLKDRDIDVSIREGNIRISFHIYNEQSHIEHLLKVLDSQL